MNMLASSHRVAIVGVDRESAELFAALSRCEALSIVRVLNPDYESLEELARLPELDIIINATNDPLLLSAIQSQQTGKVDVISGLSARILFAAGGEGFVSLRSRRHRGTIIESLEEIRDAVNVARNKQEMLRLVLTLAIQSCLADCGSIMLLDPRRRVLRIEMAEGLEGAIVQTTAQKSGEGVAGKVLRTREPLLLNGPAQVEMLHGQGRGRSDLVSAVCCPLVVGEEVIGVLNVNSKNPRHEFTPEDVQYLTCITRFVADMIWTSRDYQNAARDAFYYSLVGSVREILSLGFSFEERLNLALMKIANALEASICRYYRFDTDASVFVTCASSHVDLNLLRGRPVRLNDPLARFVLASDGASCVRQGVAQGDRLVWYVLVPVRDGVGVPELMVLQLVNTNKRIDRECAVLEKIGALFQEQYRNRRVLETCRLRTITFSVIAEFAFSFATVPDLGALATLTVSNACLVLEAAGCVLRLFDQHTGTEKLVEVLAPGARVSSHALEELDRRVSAAAITSRRTVVVDTVAQSSFASVAPAGVTSLISSAFLHTHDVVGTLSVYNPGGGRGGERDVFLNYLLQVSRGVRRFMS